MSRTAIVAGQGALPGLVAEALDAPLVYALEGFAPAIPAQAFRLERLVPLLDAMADSDVSRVVFAGAVRRPRLEPEMFDPRTATLVPRFLGAMQSGDDGALRELISIFEEWGFEVAGVEREVGRKFGRWLDVVVLEQILAGDTAPSNDLPSARSRLLT